MESSSETQPNLTLRTLSIIALIVVIVACTVRVVTTPMKRAYIDHGGYQNERQIALAAIMYSGDYDDRIPPAINGWFSRLQDRTDKQLTINCPGPGTQAEVATDAAGAAPARTWVALLWPQIKSLELFIRPPSDQSRTSDEHDERLVDRAGIFAHDPLALGQPGYDPAKNTYRNQGLFPQFGLNYMYLAPLIVPKEYRNMANPTNYAVSRPFKYEDADDPSGTIFFIDSQRAMDDPDTGFFVVNAPGMFPAFQHNAKGYIAFWGGTAGSGDWVGTDTACPDNTNPCDRPMKSNGFVYTGYNNGCNTTFLDGHVKYFHPNQLAAGTDYALATAKADGSGCHIIDKSHYLWNLSDKDYYGQ